MKFFIDSADIDEIAKAKEYGVLDGVTTNPSLIKKAVERRKKKGEKLDLQSYIKRLLRTARGVPVSLEVIGSTYEDMLAEGRRLFGLFNPVAKNVLVKIPINPAFKKTDPTQFDGLRAIKQLAKERIPVNTTLIFTPEQALLAAKAGAAIVSPFAGRIDDLIRERAKVAFDKHDYFPAAGMKKGAKVLEDNGVVSGIDLVSQIVDIFDTYDLKAEVLAASLRNPRHVREAALAGAHIATVPFSVIQDLLKHEKTREGMAKFTKDVVKEYEQLLRGR